jgi:hypothetical protein
MSVFGVIIVLSLVIGRLVKLIIEHILDGRALQKEIEKQDKIFGKRNK